MRLGGLLAVPLVALPSLALLAAAQTVPVTITWDAATVDSTCSKAVTGSGNTYNGQIDITYSYGNSGALSGTIGSGVTISAGSYSTTVDFKISPVVTFTACCISPSASIAAKFRCCCGAGTIAVSPSSLTAPANYYPICPSDTPLSPVATLATGDWVFQTGPTSYCSGCDREAQGVTKWNKDTNTCVTQSPGPAPPPPASPPSPAPSPPASGTPSPAPPPAASPSAAAPASSPTAGSTPAGSPPAASSGTAVVGLPVSASAASGQASKGASSTPTGTQTAAAGATQQASGSAGAPGWSAAGLLAAGGLALVAL